VETKQTGDIRYNNYVLEPGSIKSVRRLFGEREFIDRIGNDVTFRLRLGESIAFPLPGTDNVIILKSLGRMDYAGKRVMIEWSYSDQDGIRPLGRMLLNLHVGVSFKEDNVFFGYCDPLAKLGWSTILALTGIESAGAGNEVHLFKISEEGFIVTHRNGEIIKFHLVDGKLVEDKTRDEAKS
jgi:hypothetical protein